ncbi:MAG: DNA cytosine methyltransferase [Anaerolineae bacterium]|nr:DNA cytosine methyltransferase [Anaerolineae bacterium]
MQTYLISKIGQNKGAPRLWLEGNRPLRAGFEPGARYTVEAVKDRSSIILRVADTGPRVVSRKERSGREVPVIDINSQELLAMFEGMESVRVIMRDREIHILPLATETRKKERVERLSGKLAGGQPISVGSLSHGGGVLSHAMHEGLQAAGLDVELAFANDIRPELLDQAHLHNNAWDAKTAYVAAPMQELAYDEWAATHLPKVDILEAGIPCSGASVAGRAKRGLGHPEEHPEVGHLVVAFLSIISRVNPAVICLENVPQYASTASMSIIRTSLREMGYNLHERVLNGAEWNLLEHRQRMCLVAVSEGIEFDFDALGRPEPQARTLSEILEDVPLDDPRWSPMTGLKAKEERDKAAGKGFRMQIVTGADDHIPTLTKGIAKNRSTDPKIRHPENPGLLRLPTPVEHARAKGVPEELIQGLCATTAHELLGQSICYTPFFSVARLIGEAITKWRRSLATVPAKFADLAAPATAEPSFEF